MLTEIFRYKYLPFSLLDINIYIMFPQINVPVSVGLNKSSFIKVLVFRLLFFRKILFWILFKILSNSLVYSILLQWVFRYFYWILDPTLSFGFARVYFALESVLCLSEANFVAQHGIFLVYLSHGVIICGEWSQRNLSKCNMDVPKTIS